MTLFNKKTLDTLKEGMDKLEEPMESTGPLMSLLLTDYFLKKPDFRFYLEEVVREKYILEKEDDGIIADFAQLLLKVTA